MEHEVVSLLPTMLEGIDHAPLVTLLQQQREGAQEVLGVLSRIKQGDMEAATGKDFKRILQNCTEMMKAGKRGCRDLKIVTFAEKIINQEIECCSCLVSIASKLGYDEEADILHKNLRKKEGLERKLNAMKKHFLGGRLAPAEGNLPGKKTARIKKI